MSSSSFPAAVSFLVPIGEVDAVVVVFVAVAVPVFASCVSALSVNIIMSLLKSLVKTELAVFRDIALFVIEADPGPEWPAEPAEPAEPVEPVEPAEPAEPPVEPIWFDTG